MDPMGSSCKWKMNCTSAITPKHRILVHIFLFNWVIFLGSKMLPKKINGEALHISRVIPGTPLWQEGPILFPYKRGVPYYALGSPQANPTWKKSFFQPQVLHLSIWSTNIQGSVVTDLGCFQENRGVCFLLQHNKKNTCFSVIFWGWEFSLI